MLNIGYLGFGKSATRYHIPFVNIRKNMTIKAVYAPIINNEKASQLALDKSIFMESIESFLAIDDIQLVAICTPPASHYDLAMTCLKAGKNILIEKPFCETLKQAEEILSYAKSLNLIAMPFQNRRFDNEMIQVREIISSGILGDIFEIEIHFDRYRPNDNRQKGSYVNGEFYGLGVHLLDKVISLFGSPKHVTYDIKALRKPENPDDVFEIQLFYDRMKATVKSNQLILGEYPVIRIHGNKGSYVKYGMDTQEFWLKQEIMPGDSLFALDNQKGHLTLYQEKEYSFELDVPKGDYGKIYDSLYDTIINRQPKLVSDEETLSTMKILFEGFHQEIQNH